MRNIYGNDMTFLIGAVEGCHDMKGLVIYKAKHQAGWIGPITGVFGDDFTRFNRMAHLINMRPNDEFYLMGRVPPPSKQT